MALVLAAGVLVFTLLLTAGIGIAHGQRCAIVADRVSPWPVLIGGCLLSLLIALNHAVPW